MKKTKRLSAVLAAVLMLLSMASCGSKNVQTPNDAEETTVSIERESKTKIAALNGPTGIGLVKFARDRSYGYEVEYYTDPQEIVPLITTGQVDIAALPINLAANLYKKTDGGIQMLALNTGGVLHVIENGETVNDINDLKGKTVYATGQGSTPEYIINYVLTQNGIDPEKDVEIVYMSNHNELASAALSGKEGTEICILPEPYVTKVLMAEDSPYREALDITQEWDKVCDVPLAQGCAVARKEFIEQNPDLVDEFLFFYEVSINFLYKNIESAAKILTEEGYVNSIDETVSLLNGCNLIYVDGSQMAKIAKATFEVLFNANPASVGGSLPPDDLYYVK